MPEPPPANDDDPRYDIVVRLRALALDAEGWDDAEIESVALEAAEVIEFLRRYVAARKKAEGEEPEGQE